MDHLIHANFEVIAAVTTNGNNVSLAEEALFVVEQVSLNAFVTRTMVARNECSIDRIGVADGTFLLARTKEHFALRTRIGVFEGSKGIGGRFFPTIDMIKVHG